MEDEDKDEDNLEHDDAISKSLRKSLFPHVSPYMIFSCTPGDSIRPLPGSCLPWQAVSGMSQAVSDCVQQAGFTITQVLWCRYSAHLYLFVPGTAQ